MILDIGFGDSWVNATLGQVCHHKLLVNPFMKYHTPKTTVAN